MEDVFDSINIQCDVTSVYFLRNWLPLDILSNKNIGLKNKKVNQWSNGKQLGQEPDSEFPYFIVGAVICKNIQINGFKTNDTTKELLIKIQ